MPKRPIFEHNLPEAREVKLAKYEDVINTNNTPKNPIPFKLVDSEDNFANPAEGEFKDKEYWAKKKEKNKIALNDKIAKKKEDLDNFQIFFNNLINKNK